MPGVMNARYETLPVGMPRTRLNTCPKTTSQSVGCTARVNNSVGSRSSFFISTSAMAALSEKTLKTRDADASREAAGNVACALDVAIISSLVNRAAAVVREHVVERGVRSQRLFQFRRLADHADSSLMHDGQLVAQRFGFVHIVRRD